MPDDDADEDWDEDEGQGGGYLEIGDIDLSRFPIPSVDKEVQRHHPHRSKRGNRAHAETEICIFCVRKKEERNNYAGL